MSQAYDWMISMQATERIIQLSRTIRRKLIGYFDYLAGTVHIEPEGKFTNSEGIEFYLSTIDSMVVTYQIDHAVKLVYIVALE